MKRITGLLMALFLAAVPLLGGCSKNNGTSGPGASFQSEAQESEQFAEEQPGEELPGATRILIVYYSLTGTTERVAELLQQKTGGDIHRLETETPYPEDYDEVTNEVTSERESGSIRALKGQLPDISAYDLVFIGGPVWGGEPANPLQKYLSETDFDGVRVAGFWTSGGNSGDYANRFSEQVKNADVRDGLDLTGAADMSEGDLDEQVNTWLKALGVLQ